jgi:ABC-type phosphate/phosphonate transport system substrate-binding protein
VVVRAGLDETIATQLQQALLALNDGPQRKLLRNLYNVDGYVPVTHETYETVEQIARSYGFLGE